jgi:hypothetical protein
MNEARARLVTEYIEECWHTMKADLYNHPNCYCTKCGTSGYGNDCRTFANWDDFGKVVEVLKEKEDWQEFFVYTRSLWWWRERDKNISIHDHYKTYGDFTLWLFTDPARLCDLVGEWLETEEKKGE